MRAGQYGWSSASFPAGVEARPFAVYCLIALKSVGSPYVCLSSELTDLIIDTKPKENGVVVISSGSRRPFFINILIRKVFSDVLFSLHSVLAKLDSPKGDLN